MKRFKSNSHKAHAFYERQKEQQHREACQNKPRFFVGFEEYVKAYPEAERYRRFFEREGYTTFLSGFHTCLIGNYYTCSIIRFKNDPLYYVYLTDGDDLNCQKGFSTRGEAEQEIERLKTITPFDISDLKRNHNYITW